METREKMCGNILRYSLAFAALSLSIVGCGVEVVTTTAITSELQAQQVGALQRQVDAATRQSAEATLRHALDTYYGEKGSYPATLEALVPEYLPSVPVQPDGQSFGYDPTTGRIFRQVPGGPTPQDFIMMQQIREAITRYGMATGYYPPTLEALYPSYLSQPPRTSSGEPFIYDNQTGYVAHPRQVGDGNTGGHGYAAASGVSPSVDGMTGLSLQQGMSSHGSAGSSPSRMSEPLRGITQGHNDTQNRVMDNLGL